MNRSERRQVGRASRNVIAGYLRREGHEPGNPPAPGTEARINWAVLEFMRRYGRVFDPRTNVDPLDTCRLVVLGRHTDRVEWRAQRLYEKGMGSRVRLADGTYVEAIPGSTPPAGEDRAMTFSPEAEALFRKWRTA